MYFTQQRWWPTALRPGRTPPGPNPPPTSPLIWAIFNSCAPAVSALLTLLRESGNTDLLNRPSPSGELPLVAAAAHSNVEMCEMLIEAGADIMEICGDKQSALWEAMGRYNEPEGASVTSYLTRELLRLHAQEEHRAAVVEFLHRPCRGGLTLAQRAVMKQADEVILSLAEIMHVNLVHTGDTPLRIACSVRLPSLPVIYNEFVA